MSEETPLDRLDKNVQEIRHLIEELIQRTVATETKVEHLEKDVEVMRKETETNLVSAERRFGLLEVRAVVAGAIAGAVGGVMVMLIQSPQLVAEILKRL